MADLGTIGIAIEVRGREALRQIENDMSVVDRTAKSAARSFEVFERAGLKTADTFRYMSDEATKRLAQEQKITQELVRQRSAAEQLARANAQKFQSQIGSNLGLGAQGISAGSSADAYSTEIERLRMKYDQIYASSQLYEKSLMELNRAHMLGVTSSKQHEAAIESLNAEYQAFQNGTAGVSNRFAQGVQQTAAGVNNAGVLMQQLGYQAGDFIVQVQSGTNAFVAFGQQATQMVGFLPLLAQELNLAKVSFLGLNVSMAGLTLGLSIIIPLLTAAGALWMRTRDGAKESAESVDTYAQAIKNLTLEVERNQAVFLKAKFGVESEGVASALQEEIDLRKQIAETQQNILNIEASLESFRSGRGAAITNLALNNKREELALAQENLVVLEEALAKLEAQSEAQRMLNGGLSTAAALEKQAVYEKSSQLRLAKDYHTYMIAIEDAHVKAVGNAVRAQNALNDALSSGDADNFNKAINDALDAGIQFSKTDLNSIVAMAAKNGWSLAEAIRAAARAAQVGPVVNADVSAGPAFEGRGRVRGTMAQATYKPTFSELYLRDIEKGDGGGAGGSQRDVIADFQKQLELEKELIGASEAYRKVRQALGDDFKTTNPEVIAGLIQQAAQIEHLKELEQERKQILDTVQSSLEDGFMSMIDGTESVKDAFRNMAKEIIKELYRVLVVQRMVGSFNMSSGSGTGIVGFLGGLFTGARASGGTMMPNRSYLVGENGPELVIPRHSGTVVNANQTANAAGGSGTTVVNNNISVTGSDAAMVRAEVAKMIPQITNATKAAVIDARLRGGQMKQAFR